MPPACARLHLPECWALVASWVTFEDLRCLLEAGIVSKDANEVLEIESKRLRLQIVLTQTCEFMTLAEIGTCVAEFAESSKNSALAYALSDASVRIMQRNRRRPPIRAVCPCPTCF
mmetsp:Transcript_51055/g.102552  ORF Transcript_51055/g.102552 Transcript_51055/m.102552 type:complete len:116 (-) Transcript_51055:613-960(-)